MPRRIHSRDGYGVTGLLQNGKGQAWGPQQCPCGGPKLPQPVGSRIGPNLRDCYSYQHRVTSPKATCTSCLTSQVVSSLHGRRTTYHFFAVPNEAEMCLVAVCSHVVVSCPWREPGGTFTHLDKLPAFFLQLPGPPAPSSQSRASQHVTACAGTGGSRQRAAASWWRGLGDVCLASEMLIYVQAAVWPALMVK